jgi:hypothetical protein
LIITDLYLIYNIPGVETIQSSSRYSTQGTRNLFLHRNHLPDGIEERYSAEPDHVDGEVMAVRLVRLRLD